MKSNKKGISLIVLVITIIVIIILAAAIILSLNNNNPIAKANDAVEASDIAEAQSAFNVWLGSKMAEYKESLKVSATIGGEDDDGLVNLVSTVTGEVVAGDEGCELTDLGLDPAVIDSITIENNKVTEVKKK